MISVNDPTKSYEFFLKTDSSVVSEHKFFLGKKNVTKMLTQIKENGNIYKIIPGLENKFLGGKNVKLKYGHFIETESVLIDWERYSTEPKQISGLLLPHYQILSKKRMDENIMELALDGLEHKLFVKALDNFPEAEQFHRMRSFEFEPVEIIDIVLNAEQLKNNR